MAAASKVSCPTLLVIGAEDKMTPAKAGLKLVSAIDGASAVTIPGAGHMMMIEKSDETLAALKTLL